MKPKPRKRSTLSDEEKAARKAARDAEQKRQIQEWAKEAVKDLPPLRPDQIAKLAVLLRPQPRSLS